MQKPKKAYLVQESCTGFGLTCFPVVVLNVHADGKFATVSVVNVTENRLNGNRRARIPLLGSQITVRVEKLASSRIRALAKIAFALRDLDEPFEIELAMSQPPARAVAA